MFEFMDKVYHVFTHGRAVDAIDEPTVLVTRVFGFHLLHDLFAERADFSRARDRHIFR